MVKEYNKEFNIVYIACHEAAINRNFNITTESMTEGIIEFKVGLSWFSYGEKFRIIITKINATATKVEVESKASAGIQVYDWGKNKNNINGFFETLSELLKK
jgi:hypothetical protein